MDIINKEYFINTVFRIVSLLGFRYNKDEIQEKCNKENFYLCFKNKKLNGFKLGIWTVGEWNNKYQYGLETYKPLTISIFLIHEYCCDKFRPTYSNVEFILEKQNNLKNIENIVDLITYYINKPINKKDIFYIKTKINFI